MTNATVEGVPSRVSASLFSIEPHAQRQSALDDASPPDGREAVPLNGASTFSGNGHKATGIAATPGEETMVSTTRSVSSWEEERRRRALDKLCLLGEVASEGPIPRPRKHKVLRAAIWSAASVVATLAVACGAGLIYIRTHTDDILWKAQATKSRVVEGVWIDNATEATRNPAFHRVNFEPLVIPLDTGEGVLKGLFLSQPEKAKDVPTIIWLFGQGNNTGSSLGRMSKLYKKLGCNVIACDYRGIGGSSGEPNEEALLAHGKILLDYLIRACSDRIDLGRVFVWGHSLGVCSALAVMADPQSSEKLAGGIFENGFTSLLAIAKRREPFLSPIMRLGLKYKLANVDTVKNICRPALFLQGDADESVPPQMTSELFKWCPSKTKQIGIVQGGSHSLLDTSSPEFLENIRDFLRSPTKPKSPIWRITQALHTSMALQKTADEERTPSRSESTAAHSWQLQNEGERGARKDYHSGVPQPTEPAFVVAN